MSRGAAIRARREALGLSIDAVARAVRIAPRFVRAIEEDRLDDLPTGYGQAYVRLLEAHLTLDGTDEDEPELVTPPQGAPLWVVRALAMLSLGALAVLLGSYALDRLVPDVVPVRAADQHLVVAVQKRTALRVEVDGAVALDRTVDAGEQLAFDGADRIALSVRSTSHVHLAWNGVAVVPQGRQDAPRELVFVDDRGLQW